MKYSKICFSLLAFVGTIQFLNAEEVELDLIKYRTYEMSCNFECISDDNETGEILMTNKKGKEFTLKSFSKKKLRLKKKQLNRKVENEQMSKEKAKKLLQKTKKTYKALKKDYKEYCEAARKNYLHCNDLDYGSCTSSPGSGGGNSSPGGGNNFVYGNITIKGNPYNIASLGNEVTPYLLLGVNAFDFTEIKVGLTWLERFDFFDLEFRNTAEFELHGIGDHGSALGNAIEGQTNYHSEFVDNHDGSYIDGVVFNIDGDSVFRTSKVDYESSTARITVENGRLKIHFKYQMYDFDGKPFIGEIEADFPHVCFPDLDKNGSRQDLYTVGNSCMTSSEFYCSVHDMCGQKGPKLSAQSGETLDFTGMASMTKKIRKKSKELPLPNLCIKAEVKGDDDEIIATVKTLSDKDGNFTLKVNNSMLSENRDREIVVAPALEDESLSYSPSMYEYTNIDRKDIGEEFTGNDFTQNKE